jgi:hypothetical protein
MAGDDLKGNRQPRYRVTQVAARRVLEFVSVDGRARQVVVRIGHARRDRQHANGDWVCPFDITGMPVARRRWAYGIDGVQALSLAYHIIPTELTWLAKQAGGGRYSFLGEEGISFADGCGLLLNDVLDRAVGARASAGKRVARTRR